MLRKLWSFIVGEATPVVVNIEHDVDEIAKRVAAEVLAGIKAEIAKAKQVAARPKVAVKKSK